MFIAADGYKTVENQVGKSFYRVPPGDGLYLEWFPFQKYSTSRWQAIFLN